MIRSTGKTVLALACFFGILGFTRVTIDWVIYEDVDSLYTFGPFLGGVLFYALLWSVFFSRKPSFWSVFEHEMIHVVFALLFFKRIDSFYASRGNGKVTIGGDNFIITLAPYFFPLITILIILFKPAVGELLQPPLNVAMGFTLMFHFIHLGKEFHFKQTDLLSNGLFFSTAVILFFNIFFVGLCIAALGGRWADMGTYLSSGWGASCLYVEYLVRVVSAVVTGISP